MVWALIIIVNVYGGLWYAEPRHFGEYASYEDCVRVYQAARKRDAALGGTCVKIERAY